MILLACFICEVRRSEVLKVVLLKNHCMKFIISSVFMWFLEFVHLLVFRNNCF
jgi:hypothetical protein